MSDSFATIKVYHGYGHKESLVVYGHVLTSKPEISPRYTNNVVYNVIHLIKLFFVTPLPGVRLQMQWKEQTFETVSEADGFFRFEWQSNSTLPAGWHDLAIHLRDEQNQIKASGNGKVFVPHVTQYGFISDIDDTVLVSHSSTTGKKLRVLLTSNPRSRKTFADVVKYYQLLSAAHTEPDVPNPFFYVSSSEWNLYDYLNEFFKYNELPKGIFLLNEIKKWYQLLKLGKTKHQGKLVKLARILQVYPKQRFVLLGDNSQSDPEIYSSIANKYPERIVAIYLRNISKSKEASTQQWMAFIQNKNIPTCLFKHTDEAIQHSKSIGLIEK
ncbi:MAG: phosphatase domain-containing protein [Chryseolinea sp.]